LGVLSIDPAFMKTLAFLVFLSCLASSALAAARPNILLIVTDDLGYGDVNVCPTFEEEAERLKGEKECNSPAKTTLRGARAAMHPHPASTHHHRRREEPLERSDFFCPFAAPTTRTPRIRSIAQRGQIMTQFLSGRPICTPSRAGLMSGRDPTRFRMGDMIFQVFQSPAMRGGYPAGELSVAEALKEQGYTTGLTGKWHIGVGNSSTEQNYAHMPWNHGFDYAKSVLPMGLLNPCPANNLESDPDSQYAPCLGSQLLDWNPATRSVDIMQQPIRLENLTMTQLESSLDFIRQASTEPNKPWFLAHMFHAVHVPYSVSRFFASVPPRFPDRVEEVDFAVGQLLDAVDLENTVVVFTSDNGANLEHSSSFCPSSCDLQAKDFSTVCRPCSRSTETSNAGPLKGGKGTTWEGGLRIPMVISYPPLIPAGSINHALGSLWDLHPSFVNLAGGVNNGSNTLDGSSLVNEWANPLTRTSNLQYQREFQYVCGTMHTATRVGRYKVAWATKPFRPSGQNNVTTNPDLCAQSGECCATSDPDLFHGSGPCGCTGYDFHDPPLVFDLIEDVHEDSPLDSTNFRAVEATRLAVASRRAWLESVAQDLQISFAPSIETSSLQKLIQVEPTLMQVDACLAATNVPSSFSNSTALQEDGLTQSQLLQPDFPNLNLTFCPLVPVPLQLSQFRPYLACARENASDACRSLYPCCEGDANYQGPWEFAVPSGPNGERKRCGCNKLGSEGLSTNMLNAICQWQNDAGRNAYYRPQSCQLSNSGTLVLQQMAQRQPVNWGLQE